MQPRRSASGFEFGKTDEHCDHITGSSVHIRDLNATILNPVGIDFNRLAFEHQGLEQGLMEVEPTRVVKEDSGVDGGPWHSS